MRRRCQNERPPGPVQSEERDQASGTWAETERITRSPRTVGGHSSGTESLAGSVRARRVNQKVQGNESRYGPGEHTQLRYYTRARSREANVLGVETACTGSSLTVYSSGEGSANQPTTTGSGSGAGSGSGQGSGSGSGAGGTGSSSMSNDAMGSGRSGSGGSNGSQGRGDRGTEDTPVSMQRAHSTEAYPHRDACFRSQRNLEEQMELVQRCDSGHGLAPVEREVDLHCSQLQQQQQHLTRTQQQRPERVAMATLETKPMDRLRGVDATRNSVERASALKRTSRRQVTALSPRAYPLESRHGQPQVDQAPFVHPVGPQQAPGVSGKHLSSAMVSRTTALQMSGQAATVGAQRRGAPGQSHTLLADVPDKVTAADSHSAGDEAVSVSTSSFERQRQAALENPPPSPLMMMAAHVVPPRLPPDLGLALQPDDPDGHVQYNVGESLGPTADFPNGRYQILAPLGSGTFGKVVSCWDRATEQLVAVKIIRAIRKYAEAARMEIDILLELGRKDPASRYHCVRLLSYFTHLCQQDSAHVCLVFEHLGPSLFDVLMRNHFRPLPVPILRAVARQLLEAIAFLHEHNQTVHTDIKPENVLIVPSSYYPNRQITERVQIRLIDFGSASRLDKVNVRHAIVSTRHYRAPEIILGTGWSFACDIWSFGAMMVECYTGQTLFQSHDDLEHLELMRKLLQGEADEVITPPPRPSPSSTSVSSQRRREALKLFRDGRLNWPDGIEEQVPNSLARQKSIRRVARMPQLRAIFRPEHADLLHLIRCCLTIDPGRRWRPSDLLRHPFFLNTFTPIQ